MVVPTTRDPGRTADAAEGARAGAKVGVVGSGTMATGIIEVVRQGPATTSPSVARAPRRSRPLPKALAKSLEKEVRRGRLDRGRPRRGPRPRHLVATLDELADLDLVIEAVVEDAAA